MDQNSDCKEVYASEIEAHEAHSQEWWNPRGSMRPLHTMNNLRIPLLKKGLLAANKIGSSKAAKSRFLDGLTILDVGCGGGILSEALASVGGQVTGLDPSVGLVAVANKHASTCDTDPPSYICDTIEHHSALFPAQYDVVVASEVVEHVPNKETFLTACIAALKPGGSLFVTTPNRTYLSWLGAIFLCEDVLRIVPRGFHSWRQFIHHSELVSMIENMDCEVKTVKGMFYNPIRNKWSWSFTKTFIYAMHAVKSK